MGDTERKEGTENVLARPGEGPTEGPGSSGADSPDSTRSDQGDGPEPACAPELLPPALLSPTCGLRF